MYHAFVEDRVHRTAEVVVAIYFALVGVMLWLRARFALQAYALTGVGALCWGTYRLWSAGYTTTNAGLIIGGVTILFGCWSVAEEL
jgi:hypothetical protein